MVKLVLNTSNGRSFVLGLSHINLDKLREGQPIMFDAAQLGIEGDKIIILAGETEEKISEDLLGQLAAKGH